MKKAAAIAAIIAILLSLSACKVHKELSDDELRESLSNAESQRIAESQSVEVAYSEGVEENIDEVGKTVKNKKLVVKSSTSYGTECQAFIMDKKGNLDYCMVYRFFDSMSSYKTYLGYPDSDDEKQVKHDDKARMIVYKVKMQREADFATLYDEYSGETAKSYGYTVIE